MQRAIITRHHLLRSSTESTIRLAVDWMPSGTLIILRCGDGATFSQYCTMQHIPTARPSRVKLVYEAFLVPER